MADAVCQILIFVGLGCTPYVSFGVACFALIGYQTLVILIYIRTRVVGEFRIAYSGLGPTEARLLTFVFFASTGYRELVRLRRAGA